MKLGRDFFDRSTLRAAPELLGKVLVHRVDGVMLAGRIVEVEAYRGPEDRASHAARKRSPRARIMFGPPGMIYVYLVYGMHHCLNLVTEHDGNAGAVLVRAIEPVGGIARMRRNRGASIDDRNLANGPGKLCQAMAITLTHNQADACGNTIWVADRGDKPESIRQTPRIGIDYAGDWATRPWRFTIDS